MARNKHPEVTKARILDASLKLFLEKGYEQTTIQDIINALGDLSKGAIYHHFKSKEDIIEAVADNLYGDAPQQLQQLRALAGSTGLEKLKNMVRTSLTNPNQNLLIAAAPTLLKNPRFLAQQLHAGATDVAPVIQAYIEEGIADGSIKPQRHPKELAEVLILLSNIWLNPLVFTTTAQGLYHKFVFLKELVDTLGVPIFDDEMLAYMENYRSLAEESKTT